MDFIDGAINGGNNDWIKCKAVGWECPWLEALKEAGGGVTKEGEEADMRKLAGKDIFDAKKLSEEK